MSTQDMQPLVSALIDGDSDLAVAEAKNLIDGNADPQDIVTNAIDVAMSKLDAKCTVNQFNLLEIMLAGRAVLAVISILFPEGTRPARDKGTVLVASLEGDVHDLGKNIVRTVLTCNGYNVIDCGKDCPVGKVVEIAARESPIAIAISGLITTITPKVREIRTLLTEKGVNNVKLLAGGAALRQFSASNLQVDYVGNTVFDANNYIDDLRGREDE